MIYIDYINDSKGHAGIVMTTSSQEEELNILNTTHLPVDMYSATSLTKKELSLKKIPGNRGLHFHTGADLPTLHEILQKLSTRANDINAELVFSQNFLAKLEAGVAAKIEFTKRHHTGAEQKEIESYQIETMDGAANFLNSVNESLRNKKTLSVAVKALNLQLFEYSYANKIESTVKCHQLDRQVINSLKAELARLEKTQKKKVTPEIQDRMAALGNAVVSLTAAKHVYHDDDYLPNCKDSVAEAFSALRANPAVKNYASWEIWLRRLANAALTILTGGVVGAGLYFATGGLFVRTMEPSHEAAEKSFGAAARLGMVN